jgi:hypothetical protein
MPFALRRCLCVAFFAVPAAAIAQSGNRIAESNELAVSPWQAEVARMDDAMRARTLSSDAPRARWMAAEIERTDIELQVANLAQARTRMPAERLYLASLAVACLQRVQPLPEPCDATDRLADWATRDVDNGLPSLLLAERARERNNGTAMIAYLEEAAGRPRFDDYSAQAGLAIWEEVKALPGPAEPAARVELAATYALRRPAYGAASIQALCRDAVRFGDAARAACVQAGNALARRGATFNLRATGARMAQQNATAPDAQQASVAQTAAIERRAFECAQAGDPVATALHANDAAVRAQAVAQWDARVRREAQVGEVAACGSA